MVDSAACPDGFVPVPAWTDTFDDGRRAAAGDLFDLAMGKESGYPFKMSRRERKRAAFYARYLEYVRNNYPMSTKRRVGMPR